MENEIALKEAFEKGRKAGFTEGLEAEHELCKHPIYCRGCNNCGEEGCCGPHDNCPSGTVIEQNRKQAEQEGYRRGLEEAAEIVEKEIVTVWYVKRVAERIRRLKDKK